MSLRDRLDLTHAAVESDAGTLGRLALLTAVGWVTVVVVSAVGMVLYGAGLYLLDNVRQAVYTAGHIAAALAGLYVVGWLTVWVYRWGGS